MPKIEVYATQTCPYCRMAEALLDRKGVEYTKIFIGDHHVGGFDDLSALNAAGELDPLLEQ